MVAEVDCPWHDVSSQSAWRSSPRLRTASCLGSQAFSFSGVENTGEEKEQDVSFVIQLFAPHQVVCQNFAGGPDLRPYPGPSGLPDDLALHAREALLRRAWTINERITPLEMKQNYERPICVRLKDEEFNAICRYLSSASGVEGHPLKRGEFSNGARKLLMKGISSGVQESPKPVIDRELALDIRAEIRRIGINVNQLARNMNAIFKRREYISNETANKVTKSLDMAVQHLDDIMKRVIELS